MRGLLLFAVIYLFASGSYSLLGQSKKIYTTKKHAGETIVIDGLGEDRAWQTVEWGGQFTQREPSDGAPPYQQTAFKILYDDKNLYVLIRAYDNEPEKIAKRMSRRDGFEGDFVEINLDSYFDQRTAFSFTASVSGVKGDEVVSNNGNEWDESWDPIWYLKTAIDKEGWNAEFRVPLSQLRFGNKEEQIWGLQVSRKIFRKEEWSTWQYIPKNATGWVHLFGELHGIKGIKPQKQIEIMPYIVGKMERYAKEEGNPFATGKEEKISAGVDGKIGITSDITLDFTVNPDFGQVEADPSQVNLTAYEVFFKEQRPFFVESKNILDYQISAAETGGQFTKDNLFYSRRVGRPPQYFPHTAAGEYVDQQDQSTILGAFKVTGKTKTGLSFGILEAVTEEERAKITDNTNTRKVAVEPLTHYSISRVQKDFNKGNTILGGIFTATNRRLTPELANSLHREAYSGGIDFTHFWKERTYFVSGNFLASKVLGNEHALLETQTSQQRFFQRPLAPHVAVDSFRTSMTGTGGTLKLGKKGGGHFSFETGVTWRSPGFEVNDVGYLRSSDQINQFSWVGYQTLKAAGFIRNLFLNVNEWSGWDFSGTKSYLGFNFNFRIQLKNYWWIGGGITPETSTYSNADLRGGPGIKYPGMLNYWYFFQSDNRKKLQVTWEHNLYSGYFNYYDDNLMSLTLSYRPFNALQISANPSFNLSRQQFQYVATKSYKNNNRYIEGTIKQKTIAMSFRVNFIITPNLSLQYYGQPFASNGDYSDFKNITNSKAKDFNNRFHLFSSEEISFDSENSTYAIDEDKDGLKDYNFSNPDFNFLQFRSNFVARWEYIPGSTVFLVWSQSRTGNPTIDDFTVPVVSRNLLDIKAHNVFLIKYTYRFRL